MKANNKSPKVLTDTNMTRPKKSKKIPKKSKSGLSSDDNQTSQSVPNPFARMVTSASLYF